MISLICENKQNRNILINREQLVIAIWEKGGRLDKIGEGGKLEGLVS